VSDTTADKALGSKAEAKPSPMLADISISAKAAVTKVRTAAQRKGPGKAGPAASRP
jgi:hypothetical protein